MPRKPRKPKKVYADDDGRTIANMNVDGMPWYTPEKKEGDAQKAPEDELSREEKRAARSGMMLAALLIAGIFIVAALVFILFCLFVWLK